MKRTMMDAIFPLDLKALYIVREENSSSSINKWAASTHLGDALHFWSNLGQNAHNKSAT